jgi:hypothetical protein
VGYFARSGSSIPPPNLCGWSCQPSARQDATILPCLIGHRAQPDLTDSVNTEESLHIPPDMEDVKTGSKRLQSISHDELTLLRYLSICRAYWAHSRSPRRYHQCLVEGGRSSPLRAQCISHVQGCGLNPSVIPVPCSEGSAFGCVASYCSSRPMPFWVRNSRTACRTRCWMWCSAWLVPPCCERTCACCMDLPLGLRVG